jgi:hypothetical protein
LQHEDPVHHEGGEEEDEGEGGEGDEEAEQGEESEEEMEEFADTDINGVRTRRNNDRRRHCKSGSPL